MLTIPTSDELTAERCRRSLGRFVREAWPLVEARPFVSNWHIDTISEHLEAITAGEIRRLIVNIPPRGMKSLTVDVFWPTWEWLTDASIRWLFASYAQPLATRDSLRARRVIQSEGGMERGTLLQRRGYQGLLRLLSQDWRLAVDQNVKTRYDNDAHGYRISSSFGGTVTGEGGDRRVIDDPHKADDIHSEVIRSGELRWYDEVWASRGIDPATDTEVVIMQRLHEEDLTGHLLERGGWEHLCLPAEYEPKHPFTWPDDPRTKPGELLFPRRMPQDYLDQKKVDLGSYGYAGQFQQRPAPAEGGIFKREWWQRFHDRDGAYQCHRLAQSLDCTFKETDGTDYVVLQAWICDQADRYLTGQIRARLSLPETLVAVKAMTDWLGARFPHQLAHSIYVEDKANGPAVIASLKRVIQGMTAVEPEGGKEVRAHAVTPQIEAGNVWIPRGRIGCPEAPTHDDEGRPYRDGGPLWVPSTGDDVIDEAAGFPNGAHDDQVDALTQALNKLREGQGGKIRIGSKPRLRG